jgi:hypothetical protein|tara:strand:+ start:5396 stop:5842 length:447 start_codon:yes stop_codon:yes gene_type:complete
MMMRSKTITQSARGKPCALRLPGICNGNPETTVWAHVNGFGKGMGVKTHDLLGFPACSACHAAYDQGNERSQYTGDAFRALCETLIALWLVGVLSVPLDKPKPSHERPVPKRKPKGERAEIPTQPDAWGPKGVRKIQGRNDLRRKVTT